jgi:O-antigen ligase
VAVRESDPVTRSIRQQSNPFLVASFPLLVLFLFFIFSAVMESMPFFARMRPQLILGALGLLAVLGSGRFAKVLVTPIGKCFAIFTVWFLACIPFGAWPGGSFTVLSDIWYKSALIYFMTAGLLTTLPQANRVFRTIAYAVGVLSLLALLKNGRDPTGRLMLPFTRYANANELAWTLLVGLVFVGFLYLQGTRFHKVIAALLVPPILLAMSRTGSRGAMLGTGVLIVVMLVQARRATRIKLLVAVPILLAAVVVVVPESVLLRYTTLFGTYNTYDYSQTERQRVATIGSTEARKQLLIDSLIITMRHPLMGVGPGNFMVAQNELAEVRGERAQWAVTHNAYTQISSEMGVPGLIIFFVLLYNVFKVLNSVIRTRYPGSNWQDLRQLALTLRTAFIVFLPVAFFGSFAYNSEVPILAGLTTALGFLAQNQRAIDRAANARIVAAEPQLETGVEPVPVGQY